MTNETKEKKSIGSRRNKIYKGKIKPSQIRQSTKEKKEV
jgi:hypothetical protein